MSPVHNPGSSYLKSPFIIEALTHGFKIQCEFVVHYFTPTNRELILLLSMRVERYRKVKIIPAGSNVQAQANF